MTEAETYRAYFLAMEWNGALCEKVGTTSEEWVACQTALEEATDACYALEDERCALKSVQHSKSDTCTDVSANHADWSCSGCSALLPESDIGHEQVGERFCDICHGEAQR